MTAHLKWFLPLFATSLDALSQAVTLTHVHGLAYMT
jgi:hypothetical protein